MPTPEGFAQIITIYLPEPQASLANGIMFGIPLHSRAFTSEVKASGLMHLVVLSGMNITMMAAVIEGVCTRISRKTSLLITALSIIFFTIFVGIQAPILRASITSLLTVVSLWFGKQTLALYAILLSAILSLLLHPEWIGSISFQLSYAATIGIILFSDSHHPRSSVPRSALYTYIVDELRTSLAAQVLSMPIMWFYFAQISLIGPISNMLISWTVAPIMILTAITAILGSIHPLAGLPFAYALYGLTSIIAGVIHISAHIPYAVIHY